MTAPAAPAASNQDRITAFFRGKGLTSAQIAGILGNWQIESSLNPAAPNPREGAIGLAQWEGGRRQALQAFARVTGGTETNLDTQLQFTWAELTGPEHRALASLLQTTTPQQAATVFDQQYERSSAASLPARVSAATTFAAGGIVGGTGHPAAGSTGGGGVESAVSLGGVLDGLGSLVSPGWALTHAVPGANPGALLSGFLGSLGHWIVDGALILFGVGMILVAVIVLAKGSDSGSSTTVAVTPPAGGVRSDAKGAARAEATDAAEVAAA